MKNLILLFAILVLVSSCSKTEEATLTGDSLDTDELNTNSNRDLEDKAITYLKEMGYKSTDLEVIDGGIVIQGDTFSSFEDITSLFESEEELGAKQYRTSRIALIRRGGRGSGYIPFNVWLSGRYSQDFHDALALAVDRFNSVPSSNLKFRIRCQSSRIGCRGDVTIKIDNNLGNSVLGIAGFPTRLPRGPLGKIYPSISLNVDLIERRNYTVEAIATLIAHELGHCVGFRHTDWFARVCNGGASESTPGIHIPGTPTEIDPDSWMISCQRSTTDRPFTDDDIIAIQNTF